MNNDIPSYVRDGGKCWSTRPQRRLFIVTCDGCNSPRYTEDRAEAERTVGHWYMDGYSGITVSTVRVPHFVKDGTANAADWYLNKIGA